MKQKKNLIIRTLKFLLRMITLFLWKGKNKEVPCRGKFIKTKKKPTVVKLKTKKNKNINIKATKGKKKGKKKNATVKRKKS
jgi:hypothetical protein